MGWVVVVVLGPQLRGAQVGSGRRRDRCRAKCTRARGPRWRALLLGDDGAPVRGTAKGHPDAGASMMARWARMHAHQCRQGSGFALTLHRETVPAAVD